MKQALLFFLMAFSTALCSAQDPAVTFLNGPQYQIVLDDSVETLSIPLQVRSDLDPASLQTPQLIHVASSFAPDEPALLQQFDLSLDQTSEWPILNITFDTGPWLRQGSYNLLFSIEFAGSSQSETQQIELVVPKGQLSTPTTLVVPQIISLFGTSNTESILTIKETTGRARIHVSDIALTPDGLATPDGIQTGGRLDFALPTSPTVEAGRRLELPFSLSGRFPLGKVSGDVEIESSRLDPAARFKVEVNTRRSYWVLFWTLVFGLVFGFVVRVLLTSIIDRNKARLPGFDLLGRIDEELKKRPDRLFQDELTSIRTRLEQDLEQREAKAIQDGIKARSDELNQALQTFGERMQVLSKSFSDESGLLTRGWSAPPEIETMLASAHAALQPVDGLIGSMDLVKAEELLTTLKQKNRSDFPPVVARYKQQTIQDLSLLLSGAYVLPDATRTTLQESIKLLEAISTDAPSAEVELEPLLQGLHQARTGVQQALSTTDLSLRIQFQKIIGTLNDLPNPTPAQGLINAMQKLIEDLNVGMTNPEQMLQMLPGRLGNLYETLEFTLLDIAGEMNREYIQPLLDGGKYEEATRDAVQLSSQESSESLEGTVSEIERGIPDSFPVPSFLESISLSTLRETTRILGLDAPDVPVRLSKSWTLKQLFWSQLLQTTLAGIGIVLFGFLTFSGSFIGSAQDLGSSFFWAFTLDVSVATLLNLNASKVS